MELYGAKYWSGKRDSYLASDPLKSKGFLFLPEQEKTQFWTRFWGVSRVKQAGIPGCAISFLPIASRTASVQSGQFTNFLDKDTCYSLPFAG